MNDQNRPKADIQARWRERPLNDRKTDIASYGIVVRRTDWPVSRLRPA